VIDDLEASHGADIEARRYETCQRIREVLGTKVLLVALTGFGQEEDKERATRAGFDAHLTKPAEGTALAAIFAHSRDNRRVKSRAPGVL